MTIRKILAGACILLASACGDEAPAAPPDQASATVPDDSLPVIGQEQSILLIVPKLLDGERLGKEDKFPGKLEVALRARGANGRITTIPADVSSDELRGRIAKLAAKPALALVPDDLDASVLSTLAGQGIPVHKLDMATPLKDKPDLFVRGTRRLNALGVEELVGATADGIASALSKR
jgi:hypothetical protein